MSPSALRGTLGRAHFSLENRLSQPDGLFEGLPTVHAEHHDEQVPCEIGYRVETGPYVVYIRSCSIYPRNAELLNIHVTDKYRSRTNYIFSRAGLRNGFSCGTCTVNTILNIRPLSCTSLSHPPYYATSVAIIPNRTEVATRECIRSDYNGHASHMRDTRVLWIMNIYPSGFIYTEARPRVIYKTTLTTVESGVTIPGLASMGVLLPLVPDKNAPRTKGRVGSTGCSRGRTKSSPNGKLDESSV